MMRVQCWCRAFDGLALERLTGVNRTKMLPVPNIDSKKFKHTRRWEEKGEHTKLYTFSPTDYRTSAQSGQETPTGRTAHFLW